MQNATLELPIQLPSESNLAGMVLDPDVRVLLLTAANNGSGTTTCALSLDKPPTLWHSLRLQNTPALTSS